MTALRREAALATLFFCLVNGKPITASTKSPLGRPEALAFVSAFIERAKADGTVRRAFDDGGMLHAAVASAGWVF